MQTKEQHKADLLNQLQSAFNLILNEHGLSIHERARLLEILRDLYGGIDRRKWIDVKVYLRELEDLLAKIGDLGSSLRQALDSLVWSLRSGLTVSQGDFSGKSEGWLKAG